MQPYPYCLVISYFYNDIVTLKIDFQSFSRVQIIFKSIFKYKFFFISGWMDKSSLVIVFGSINAFANSMSVIFTCQSTTFHLRSSYYGIVGSDCISCSNIHSCLVSRLYFSDKVLVLHLKFSCTYFKKCTNTDFQAISRQHLNFEFLFLVIFAIKMTLDNILWVTQFHRILMQSF